MKRPAKKFLRVTLVLTVFAALFTLLLVLNFQWKVARSFDCVRVKEDPAVWKLVRDIDSGGPKPVKYDLYLPQPPDPARSYSLIVYIHGGGFVSGDKREGRYTCPYFASKGLIAASVNYTLYSGPDSATLFSLYDEIIAATHSIKSYCAGLGYNITEMAFSGFSAGGYTALVCAYKDPGAAAVPVRFVFEQSGPAMFDPELWGKKSARKRAAFLSLLTGRKFTAADVGTEAYREAIDAVSPASMVTSGTVPTILAYGPKDFRVPPEQKDPLLEKLREHRVPHDYIEFPRSGHRLFDDPGKMRLYFETVDSYIEKYFENSKKRL